MRESRTSGISVRGRGSNPPVYSTSEFDISILEGKNGIYWRGCLDKYSLYSHQKEWRICWLPKVRNFEAKTLSVGRLDDILEIVDTKDIRNYLLKRYAGYIPGVLKSDRKTLSGTENYSEFKKRIRAIDGTGDFIMELG